MSDAVEQLRCEERIRESRVQQVLEVLNQARTPEALIAASGATSRADKALLSAAIAGRTRKYTSLNRVAEVVGGPVAALRLLELLADDEQMVPCEATGDWTARIYPWIHESGDVKVGDHRPFKLDFAPIAFSGYVRLRCSDDVITVLDDGSRTDGPSIVLPKDREKERKDILTYPFFTKDFFTVEEPKWKVAPHGAQPTTCIDISMSANFRMEKGKYEQLNEGGSIDGRQMKEDWVERVFAAFRVCCCTVDVPKSDEPPKCSWNGRRIDFHTRTLAGAAPAPMGPRIDFVLDACVGKCGECTTPRTKIPPFV